MRLAPHTMPSAGSFSIGADHPALPGHFPGQPVVPGVVLLDHASSLILAAHPGLRPSGFEAVKFRLPVRPGETIEVRAQQKGSVFAFVCLRGEEILVSGTLRAEAPAEREPAGA